MRSIRYGGALLVAYLSLGSCKRNDSLTDDFGPWVTVAYGTVTGPTGTALTGASVKAVIPIDADCMRPVPGGDTTVATTDAAGRYRVVVGSFPTPVKVCLSITVTPTAATGLAPRSRLVPNAARISRALSDSARIDVAY